MSFNTTAAWLAGRVSPMLLLFSAQLGTVSTHLSAGGAGADGFILPYSGRIKSLRVYDGTNSHNTSADYVLNTGDRISVYANYNSGTGTFAITVQVNGASTIVSVDGIPANSTVCATLDLLLREET